MWLRWFTLEGELLLTEEGERARDAEQRAKDADRRADRLADKLRELGLDPEQIG